MVSSPSVSDARAVAPHHSLTLPMSFFCCRTERTCSTSHLPKSTVKDRGPDPLRYCEAMQALRCEVA